MKPQAMMTMSHMISDGGCGGHRDGAVGEESAEEESRGDGEVRMHSPSPDGGDGGKAGERTDEREGEGDGGGVAEEGKMVTKEGDGGGAEEEGKMVTKEGNGGDAEEEGRMAMPPVGTESTLASDTRRRRRNCSSKTVDTSCSPLTPKCLPILTHLLSPSAPPQQFLTAT
ncbi:hypothetical protein KC19_11G062200 [Ceratodon purpureus]|uniref:Uncharacterized protein n=1 Tax=Ceratodon purpureus TaxID=3225 RepID=A0A8T0GBP1_CERPU|nr:hypothetical protein KC19_11G062200 [Ceratodon purpureus]